MNTEWGKEITKLIKHECKYCVYNPCKKEKYPCAFCSINKDHELIKDRFSLCEWKYKAGLFKI